jgi:hypothetical protein
MLEKDRNLSKILMMAGIFRLDEGRWPQSASELAAFVERKGWSLDFSPYHTLTFKTDAWRCLVVEVAKRAEGDWLELERIDVEPYFFERGGNQTVPLRMRAQKLPARKMENKNYCSLTA